MRIITSAALAATLLSVGLLAGCGDTSEEPAADATTEEAAADEQDGVAEAHDALPDDVMATVLKADACRALAEEADASSMQAVQDRWDEASCETLGDDLDAAHAANADNEEAIAALDHAARDIGT